MRAFLFNNLRVKGITPHLDKIVAGWGGGEVMIIVREGIPCREIRTSDNEVNIERIFLESSTRKQKWLLFVGYCNKESNINKFVSNLGSSLDIHLSRYDNLLLLGDFISI